jgi:glycosyltransferase involved in cell wall biosynthesis
MGEDRVFVVPHGVDSGYYSPVGERDAPVGADPTCLFVGSWLRDFDVLETVIRVLGEREPGIRFRVLTGDERIAKLAGLPNVSASARVDDEGLLQAYRTADLFLVPLTDCTANNALLEAMSCGLPLVVTDVGGIRDYADDRCALLVPPGDGEAMADAVLGLCRDATLRSAMAARSRERALELDWAHVADRLIEVYDAI